MARIMIVDDDQRCRLALTASLQSLNHAVCEFSRGRNAVRAFPLLQPDLVLLDVLMPDQDGIETMLALQNTSHRAQIIMMSDGGSIGIEKHFGQFRLMGAFSTLKKPFSLDELAVAINSALAGLAPKSMSSQQWQPKAPSPETCS